VTAGTCEGTAAVNVTTTADGVNPADGDARRKWTRFCGHV